MADIIFKYPLDLDGDSPANKVVGEEHTLGSRLGRVFCPNYGPVFGNTFVLFDGVTGRKLTPMVDYRLVHYYKEAGDRTGQAVYAAIYVHNLEVSTKVLMTAQYVGGEFSYSTYAILQALAAINADDRPVAWGDLVGVPSEWVPAPHLHDVYELYGMKYLVESNYEIARAIREGDAASRVLMQQQMTAKFAALDSFAMAIATCFETGAAELATIN